MVTLLSGWLFVCVFLCIAGLLCPSLLQRFCLWLVVCIVSLAGCFSPSLVGFSGGTDVQFGVVPQHE